MAHSVWQVKALALGAAAMLATGLTAPAFAQDKKPAAPAAKAGGEAAAKQSAWVKLCEKAPVAEKGADGKPTKVEKSICLTHHERLDGNTGMVLVSAAVREVEGSDKKSLMVMVPLGMAIPAGVRAAVYSQDQWAKAAKNEKIEEKDLKPIKLDFSLCHPAGCTAEVEASADVLGQMKTGGGLMVLAINAGAQPIGFPIPLDGFQAAHDGKPVDNEQYAKARSQLMAQIRERQKAAYEAFQEAQKTKTGAEEKQGAKAAAPAAKKEPGK
ncbi:MAG: invasion associated locus B family protein [Hyphomicrobiaceae bacterium]|nr:invasion associated locus B family protein [Hyphomicrobiaceae bacterium]